LLYSKNYEKSEEVSHKAFSFPPLPPLSQSIVETPSTQLVLTHADMKNYHSLFVAIPFSSRKHSFILVSQFYNSTASMINIPSVSMFRDYKFILPVGHPLVINFTLPLYTNKYPIKATLQTKYLDIDTTTHQQQQQQQQLGLGKKNFIINNIKNTNINNNVQSDTTAVTESEEEFPEEQELIITKLGKTKKLYVEKDSIILNNYPVFLPVSYQYIPQLMEEGKFVLNCTLTKVKFHQSSKPMYSNLNKQIMQSKSIKFQQQQQIDSKSNSGSGGSSLTNMVDYSPIQKPVIQGSKKILHSDFDETIQTSPTPTTSTSLNNNNNNNQIDNPHLFMFLDPFYSYEISIGFDWVGSIGSLVFSYALTIIPCTFALFLWVFSYQIHSMIKKDKFPSLLTTLRDQSLVLTPFMLYFPLGLCIFFIIIGSPVPTFYTEYFPDPSLDSFMVEQIPPFWIIPFLFMTSISVLTILILCTNFLFIIGSTINYRLSFMFYGNNFNSSNSGGGISSSTVQGMNGSVCGGSGSNINNSNMNGGLINSSILNNNTIINNNNNNNSSSNNGNINSNGVGIGSGNGMVNNSLLNSSDFNLMTTTGSGNGIIVNSNSNSSIGNNGNNGNNGINSNSNNSNSNIISNSSSCLGGISSNSSNNSNNSNNSNSSIGNTNGNIISNSTNNSMMMINNSLNNIVNSSSNGGNVVVVDTTRLYIGNFQLSFSKWIIVFIILVLVIHSALGLIAFLLLLLFSPSISSNHTTTAYGHILNHSPIISSSNQNITNNNNSSSKKKSINNQKSKNLLNYRQSIFLMYIFSAIIMVPNLIIWIKHLSFEWQIFDSYELFILFSITHICLSTIELTLNNLYILRVCLIIASPLVLVYCVLLIYRMLYFSLILSAIFMVCHIYSKLKEKYL